MRLGRLFPKLGVHSKMLQLIHNLQVFYGVIGNIPIYVVDYFVFGKFPTNKAFDSNPMGELGLSPNRASCIDTPLPFVVRMAKKSRLRVCCLFTTHRTPLAEGYGSLKTPRITISCDSLSKGLANFCLMFLGMFTTPTKFARTGLGAETVLQLRPKPTLKALELFTAIITYFSNHIKPNSFIPL